ncbi:hypothetical protein BP6252_13818 [Coleophoma cylindrospora]|uniref:AB hydrolase-1 domain-containing protein n=1 Tax=Coleophoma cylindrospora TaxID=1849047 RepID=A0A3D8Q674_9HELO|nr:hypothetical protein BP6252_13818 [Coleophoma cylindrospora]
MATMAPAIDWSRGEQSGLVSIGTHNLRLNSYGPDRKPGEPVVICIPGLASSIQAWAAVTRLLKPHIRSYTYDRSGFGGSDLSPLPPTSTNIAQELSLLLQKAPIAPPYIFVAHSWGGILIREFLHLQPDPASIASLVLLDSNHDHMAKLIDWRTPALWSMAANLDFTTLSAYAEPHGLTPTEWDIYQADLASDKHNAQADKEREQYSPSFPVIEAKGQLQRGEEEGPLLGDSPVSIVVAPQHIGFQQIYDAGLAKGNGTEEERAIVSKMLATWKETHERLQGELTALSKRTRVRPVGCQHDIHLLEPEAVVEEVLWVLNAGKE